MERFYDRNEMYVDSEDEDGEGWIPFARAKPLQPTSTSQAIQAEMAGHDSGTAVVVPAAPVGETVHAEPTPVVEPPQENNPTDAVSAETVEDWTAEASTELIDPTVRRSNRANKGIPPMRFGYEDSFRRLECRIVPRTLFFKNSLLLMEAMISVLGVSVNGLEVTVRDCRAPQYAGVMSFNRWTNCNEILPPLRHKSVYYEVMIDDSNDRTFDGYVCRVWQKVKMVKEGILFNTDTTYQEQRQAISPSQCWSLITTGRCGDGKLRQHGKVWSYHADPEGKGSWTFIAEFETHNCEYEETTFEHAYDCCPVRSITGESAASNYAELDWIASTRCFCCFESVVWSLRRVSTLTSTKV